jgi:hypothetical protein
MRRSGAVPVTGRAQHNGVRTERGVRTDRECFEDFEDEEVAMPDSTDHREAVASGRRRMKPAPLLFDPVETGIEPERFFDLESVEDPAELLDRSTRLLHAFRAVMDQATEYQALAAARLADERRSPEQIAQQAGWAPEYAQRMIEYGRLVQGGAGHPVTQE